MQTSLKYKTALAAYLLLIVMMALVHLANGAAADKEWLLFSARMWLSGKQLYVDLVEVSPPLIIWIYALVIKLSHLLAIAPDSGLTATVLVLTFFSALVCKQLIRLHPLLGVTKGDVTIYALLVVSALVLWPNPAYFADREHVFITLVLPYLVRFSPIMFTARISPALRWVVAVMAGVGFCIKPHCVVLLAAVHAYHVIRSRSLRFFFYPENLAIYVSAAAYLATTWLLYPEYFTEVVPAAMATYSMSRQSIEFVMLYLPPILSFAVAFAEFRPTLRSPLRADTYYWMLLALATLFYAYVNNGWMYTFYPLHSMVLMSMFYVWREYGWLKVNAESPLQKKSASQGAMACMLVFGMNILTVVGYAQVLWSPDVQKKEIAEQEQCIADISEALRLSNSNTFGAISLSAAFWPKLAHATGAQMETRFPNLWMLPSFMNLGDDFKHKNLWVLSYTARALAANINANKPGIILEEVATRSRATMNLREWLDFDPAFAEALTHYERMNIDPSASAAAKCPYAVYRRKKD